MFNSIKTASNPQWIYIVDEFSIQRKISILEAEGLFNIKWLEWDRKDINPIEKSFPSHVTPKLLNNSNEVLNDLEIRFMNKQYGWGLFARGYIEKGSIIGVFTGIVSLQDRQVPIVAEHIFLYDAPNNNFGIVDGTRQGNITRFLQHLPREENIKEYNFDPAIDKANVAVENVEAIVVSLALGSIKTNLFITSRDIYANEIIGCSYDPAFWEGKTPTFFRKDGSVIASQFYYKTRKDSLTLIGRNAVPIYSK